MNIYGNQGMAMKTNNDGSDDHDRDDRDNRDDHDDNDATDNNDDDNNDAVNGKHDSDDIENINDDNGYKCTHARLHIHARAPAHSYTGMLARLHTLINIGFYSREGYLRYNSKCMHIYDVTFL